MKVGIPTWQGRVSPVFDTASRLLIADLEDGKEISRTEESIDEPFLPSRANRLLELGIDTLICGAVSRPMMALISGANIQLIPFISGEVEEVLCAYLSDCLTETRFAMPGCCARRRRRKGKGMSPGHGPRWF